VKTQRTTRTTTVGLYLVSKKEENGGVNLHLRCATFYFGALEGLRGGLNSLNPIGDDICDIVVAVVGDGVERIVHVEPIRIL